ncbi:MAG: hypothetical protein ACI9PX_000455 [Reinekea sp.]|jgi:hypothetical protein
MENETRLITTINGSVCIRGLGDKFTNRYKYVDYPAACQGLPQLTITHDPAGAFDKHVTGLVLAGHTHCGQVSLPFIGSLWVLPGQATISLCYLGSRHQYLAHSIWRAVTMGRIKHSLELRKKAFLRRHPHPILGPVPDSRAGMHRGRLDPDR